MTLLSTNIFVTVSGEIFIGVCLCSVQSRDIWGYLEIFRDIWMGGWGEVAVAPKSLKPNNWCAVYRVEIFGDIWRYLEIFGDI